MYFDLMYMKISSLYRWPTVSCELSSCIWLANTGAALFADSNRAYLCVADHFPSIRGAYYDSKDAKQLLSAKYVTIFCSLFSTIAY